MKKEFVCKHCGKHYFSYKENSNFCSKSCREKHRNSITYDCDYCGKTFIITECKLKTLKNGKRKNLFCSKECADKYQNKSVEKVCEECGRTYTVHNCFKDIQKYCSKDCYEKHRSKKEKLLHRICPICNKEFDTYHPAQIHCSKECASISEQNRIECICDYCGKKFKRIKSEVDKNTHHYCSKECKNADMYWNKTDVDNLKKYYGKISKEELLNIISEKWDYDAIRRKAQWLGLTKSRKWSNQDVSLLIELYPTVSMGEVLKAFPNRTLSSILGKARSLGLVSNFYINNIYSSEDDNFLKDNYLKMTNEEMGKIIKRSSNGIAQRLYKLDLHRPVEKNNYRNLNDYMRSKLTAWKQHYKKECNYTCAITGTRTNIIVHHIKGFNLLMGEVIDILDFPLYEDLSLYPQEKLDLFVETFLKIQEYYGEYICISETVHRKFHSAYGYGYNTREQWDEFVETEYNLKKAS